jgi:hypothetical protein
MFMMDERSSVLKKKSHTHTTHSPMHMQGPRSSPASQQVAAGAGCRQAQAVQCQEKGGVCFVQLHVANKKKEDSGAVVHV